MVLLGIELSLRGWHNKGQTIPQGWFEEQFGVETNRFSVQGGESPWRAVRVIFFLRQLSEFSGDEPEEQLLSSVAITFAEASQWLDGLTPLIPPTDFKIDFLLQLWIDNETIDLVLPAQFLRSVGRHNCSISMVTYLGTP